MSLNCQTEPLSEAEIKKTGWKQPQAHSIVKNETWNKKITAAQQSNLQMALG